MLRKMPSKYMSNVMLFGTFLLSIVLSGTAAQGCVSKIKQCFNIYMDNVLLHPENVALICHDLNIYLKCSKDACDLSASQTAEMMALVRREAYSRGLNCALNIDNLTTLRPQTMNPRTVTVKPATCDDALASCTKTYLNDAFELTTTDHRFCRITQNYINCLMDSPCDAHLMRKGMEDAIERELRKRNIHCNLNFGEQFGNSATTQRNSCLAAGSASLITLLISAMMRNV